MFLGAFQTGLDKGSLRQKAEVFDAKLTGATEGLRSIRDSPGFFLAEKIKVLLNNKAAGSRLALGIPRAIDYKVTIEFNRLYTSISKPVKVY